MVSLVSAIFGEPQQPGQKQPQQKSDPVWWIHFLCKALASCVTPFIRTGLGLEGIGAAGVLSAVILFILSGANPLMTYWLIAWFVAVIIQRIITFRNMKRGVVVHSRYGGYSLLLRIPFLRKVRHIEWVEFLLCVSVAGVMFIFSDVMAAFMVVCAITIVARYGIEYAIRDRRIQKLNDARIEARWLREGM
jgi:hypothetical protein